MKTKINTSKVGAYHELLAATDLMQRGYYVFRALSPSSPCDLIAIMDKEVLRVEVTTAVRGKTKPIYVKHDPTLFDLMALVFHDGTIEYLPPLG